MPSSSPVNLQRCSVLAPFGYQTGSCGYCKDPESSASYFASSRMMWVDHYQDLIERGWRRSGETLYKPDQIRSCCPHYTIRLPVAQLKTSRDQRQTLHRWNRFVLGDKYIEESAKLYPISRAEKKRQNNEFDLLSTIHASEYSNIKIPPEPEHKFEVTLESTDFTDEKYTLFEQYQRLVHHEPPSKISKAGFRRFLCETPLVNETRETDDGKPQPLGSRHHCYRLDGQLIALGVVDLLPRGVSAVYFIYDVAFEAHSFGKLSALREAALAVEGGYTFYNMGYYIHSCTKMRYKCAYRPQHLLDPDTFEWHELDNELKAKLDARPFVSPSRDAQRQSSIINAAASDDADEMNVDEPDHAETVGAGAEKYANPNEAAESGGTLFSFGMPGLLAAADVDEEMALHVPRIMFRDKSQRRVLPADMLQGWDEQPLTEPGSLKAAVGELWGLVGVKVARDLIVDFSR